MSRSHKDMIKKLMPILMEGDNINDIIVEGEVLDNLNSDLDNILKEMFPLECSELNIEEFEKMCGINADNTKTLNQRKTAVISKLRSKGSISVEHIIYVASLLGYNIEIIENKPALCGDAECSYTFISKYNIIWQFKINVLGIEPTYFRAGESGAGDYLMIVIQPPELSLYIQDIIPAYTYPY